MLFLSRPMPPSAWYCHIAALVAVDGHQVRPGRRVLSWPAIEALARRLAARLARVNRP